jgi:hypothetical protein
MKRLVLLVTVVLVVIAAVGLVLAETGPRSVPRGAPITTVSCEGSALTGRPNAANLILGPATFLGTAQGRQIQAGPRGLFADKTFLVVAPLKNGTTARITPRVIGLGSAGFVYGTGPVAAWHSGSYRLDAAQSTYVLSLCEGEPSGFAGGIVTTGRVCVQIGVTADHATRTTRLGFGGGKCRSV